MERVLIIVVIGLILGCSGKKDLAESNSDNKDKEFADLNESEKLEVFTQIGEDFKGDYRKYLGQNEDSTKIQLLLNSDKRFAIGFKLFFGEGIENTDSNFTVFSTKSEFKNLCIGRWTDEGKAIRLKILLGQSSFFDSLKNEAVVSIIDSKTVLLDKDAKEVWIARALCKRQ